MYQLLVYYPDAATPHATLVVDKAADVLALLPQILAEHHGCLHVVVMLNEMRLFAVDCAGNRLP